MLRLDVVASPKRIKRGTPTSITVKATDAKTGKRVRGAVHIDGVPVGATGVPFAYTFFKAPRGRAAPAASGYVLAPGYLPGYVEFGVR